MNSRFRKMWEAVLKAVTDWKNLVSWMIANLIVSLPWIFFLALAYTTGEESHYATALAIYAFQMLPIPIETALVVILTVAIRKLIGDNKGNR